MEIFKHLIFVYLGIVALTVPVHARSQLGFISIDCGLPEHSGYTDEKTGIDYTSDVNFIENGVSYHISSEYDNSESTSSVLIEETLLTVRSFPEEIRNCYTLKPAYGDFKFLIRASFMYGNYDGLRKVPKFDLLLGADVWDSVELADASTIVTKEILHVSQTNYVHVCLLNTGHGTPFMSSLELRPLQSSTFVPQSGSLLLYLRLDVGSTTNETIRYNDDNYDRIWSSYSRPDWIPRYTPLPVELNSDYQLPSVVMRTVVIPANGSNSLTFSWETSNNSTSQYYVYMHFAEIYQLNNQKRQLYIYANGKLWINEPYVPKYLKAHTLYSIDPMSKLEFTINTTEESSLQPILNAIEIYQAKEFLQLLTNEQDGIFLLSNIY